MLFRSDLRDGLALFIIRRLVFFVRLAFLSDGGVTGILGVLLAVLSHLVNYHLQRDKTELTKMSLAVNACRTEVASNACSSACSALLLWIVDLSTLPSRLSSPFWFVGSVADGGVNGAGGICTSLSAMHPSGDRRFVWAHRREEPPPTAREADDGYSKAHHA